MTLEVSTHYCGYALKDMT